MIAFVILAAILLLGALEWASRQDRFRHVHLTFRADMPLCEPGECVTLRYEVYNTSPFPILSSGLAIRFDDSVRLLEDEDWCRRHVTRDFSGMRVDHHFYLLPYRRFKGKVRLTLKKRGIFELGQYYLQVGDLLGLDPEIRSGELGVRVVCTAQRAPEQELQTLGGYLGDVSVRRFLHEDPMMLIGYREYSGREPMKQISWMQSAKTGHLMVRQQDYTVDRNVTVLVNMEASQPHISERCLSLTRSVCEQLENAKIPYAMESNGDLRSLGEGLGQSHLHFILHRIGLSRLTGYTGFADLVERCARRPRVGCSYIVITPALSERGLAALKRLQACSDQEICVLYGDRRFSS